MVVAFILVTGTCWAGESDVQGRWLSGNGEGWIEIRRIGDGVIGIIAGSPKTKKGDRPRIDTKNPDPKLRSRVLDGVTIMSGFEFAGNDKWIGGTIYGPNSGKTYGCTLTLVNRDTPKLRGYIGLPLFGRSDIWSRDSKQAASVPDR